MFTQENIQISKNSSKIYENLQIISKKDNDFDKI